MDTVIIEQLVCRYPNLEGLIDKINAATTAIVKCYSGGGKILVCGNGGSCSDSEHIVGELMKSFEKKRPIENTLVNELERVSKERGKLLSLKLEKCLPAISLNVHSSLASAIANDIGSSMVFAQQVNGYGNEGDILIGISTSGNAENVVNAAITARAKKLTVIGLTGHSGGQMKSFCDILINVPELRTALVQELHIPIYHAICMMVENYFFN